MSPPLKVCLDARLRAGQVGGVQQLMLGTVGGLARLAPSDVQLSYLGVEGTEGWLAPYWGPRARLIPPLPEAPTPTLRRFLRESVRTVARSVGPHLGEWTVPIARSDGRVEREGIEVMHFTTQDAFLTEVPSVYQPQDLQHRHFPEFFTPWQLQARERRYRLFCDRAAAVIALTSWGKRDLISQLGLRADRVVVVPPAAVVDLYPAPTEAGLAQLRSTRQLPERFALFPAQAWPHKNHGRLFQALALLKAQRLEVPLICIGHSRAEFAPLDELARKLGVSGQVRSLGYVAPEDVRGLYALCELMVFPSLFEGWGMPVFEAFAAGAPVACSNGPVLAEVAKDAAELFDPFDPHSISEALRKLWEDPSRREELKGRGRARVAQFSWEHTARLFLAVYRRIGGRPLDASDQALLAAPPLA